MMCGYHSKYVKQYEVFKHLKGPNKFGVYEQEIMVNGERKKTTLFPDSWTPKKIEAKLREARLFENRVHIDKNGFIGETEDGMVIQFLIVIDKTTGGFMLNSFPYMEETVAEVLQRRDVRCRNRNGGN